MFNALVIFVVGMFYLVAGILATCAVLVLLLIFDAITGIRFGRRIVMYLYRLLFDEI